MWQQLLDWSLNFIKGLWSFGSWLFTPISISSSMDAFVEVSESNAVWSNLGIPSISRWIAEQVNSSQLASVSITPISVLGVGFISALAVIGLIKIIFK